MVSRRDISLLLERHMPDLMRDDLGDHRSEALRVVIDDLIFSQQI